MTGRPMCCPLSVQKGQCLPRYSRVTGVHSPSETLPNAAVEPTINRVPECSCRSFWHVAPPHHPHRLLSLITKLRASTNRTRGVHERPATGKPCTHSSQNSCQKETGSRCHG